MNERPAESRRVGEDEGEVKGYLDQLPAVKGSCPATARMMVVVVVMEATDGLVLLSEMRIDDGVLSTMRVTLEAIKGERGDVRAGCGWLGGGRIAPVTGCCA